MTKSTIPQLDAKNERNESPHVVILGAGASRAALPNGDKNGCVLPLINNIVKVVGLQPLLGKFGVEYKGQNFEAFYDDLVSMGNNEELLKEIEQSIYDYFSKMELPDEPTLYDYLVLSLREKDIIATFNWDPLLALAYIRNKHLTDKMPQIAFLHGNVLAGCCIEHKRRGFLNGVRCNECGQLFKPTKLLYPMRQKDYQSDKFIYGEWELLRWHIQHAYLITIFGYSAPATDVEAKKLMLEVWKKNTTKSFSWIHIIDIKTEDEVKENWKDFEARDMSVSDNIHDSCLFIHPRRSCDALAMATLQQAPWADNPFPQPNTLEDLQEWIEPLIEEENNSKKLSSKGAIP